MKTLRNAVWLLWVILSGYVVAWTFGLFVLGPMFLFFVVTGRVKIVGYWNLVRTVLKGRVLIATNHPTVVAETFGMGALLFPWYLLFPQCFVWSMPDVKLLDAWRIPGWIRVALRCVVVDRAKTSANISAALKAVRVLRAGGVVVAFPEGGRTFGNANRNRIPLEYKGRYMQEIKSALTHVAHGADAWILPGWVNAPHSDENVTVSGFLTRTFGHENKRFWPITFCFRRSAYRPDVSFDPTRENNRLQEEIFSS